MTNKNRILEKVNQYINEYDSIYVPADKDIICKLFSHRFQFPAEKKVLLLAVGLEEKCILECGIDIQPISREEYHQIKNLYYLYEFSDRIHFLDIHVQYGSLDNYIAGGLLTEEEAVMALLK